jgi:hypothetical protein
MKTNKEEKALLIDKKEESQEELFKDLLDIVDTSDKGSYGYATTVNVLKNQFTITRKEIK